jgi:hypothetical protein
MISFELFGHFHTVIDDVGPVFERAVLEMGRLVGFPPPRAGTAAAPVGADRRDAPPDAGLPAPPDGEDEIWYLV